MTAVKTAATKTIPTVSAPALKKGERWAGIVFIEGQPEHLVLLPGDLDAGMHKQALAWAKKQGGALPTRNEQAVLFGNLKAEFKPDWYWSCQPYEDGSGYAWSQHFNDGDQNGYATGYELRARAVRRIKI